MLKVKDILSHISNPNVQIPDEISFYKPVGCDKCAQIGYKGRLGLYEAISMEPSIQKLIQTENVTDVEIEAAAILNGTVTMLQDGILKAITGDTSLEEVFRVI